MCDKSRFIAVFKNGDIIYPCVLCANKLIKRDNDLIFLNRQKNIQTFS